MRAAVILSVVLAWSSAAIAQTTQPPAPAQLQQVYDCAALQDASSRLDCYDQAVRRLQEAQSSGDVVAVGRTEAQAIERDSFGFSLPSIARLLPRFGGDDRAELDNLSMEIERIADAPNGRHSFVMTNGQVWTQVEAQRVSNVRAGDTVTVHRAAMGSFMLASPRGGAGHRVRRAS